MSAYRIAENTGWNQNIRGSFLIVDEAGLIVAETFDSKEDAQRWIDCAKGIEAGGQCWCGAK